ncbi:hypothetical protein EV426DRAFT_593676 [Tirmania nivea]|nr:hypothetical protein EV426DRAFT_593676 [Tirmania nivea]
MKFPVHKGVTIPGLFEQIKALHGLIKHEQLSERFNQLLVGGGKQKEADLISTPQTTTSTDPKWPSTGAVDPSPFVNSATGKSRPPIYHPPMSHRPLAGVPENRPLSGYTKALLQRSELKLMILDVFEELLNRYLWVLERYGYATLGSGENTDAPIPAFYEDYETLDHIFDDLGTVNDLLAEFKPGVRGAEDLFGTAKVRWIKPMYKKLVMRWAAGVRPAFSTDEETWPIIASTSKDLYDDENLLVHSSASFMMELGGSVSEGMWMSGLRVWREHVIRKMIRRSSRVLLETVLFLADESVNILPPTKYGEHDKGFVDLKAAVLDDHRVYFGLPIEGDLTMPVSVHVEPFELETLANQ